jgi:hypothetical protein
LDVAEVQSELRRQRAHLQAPVSTR